MGVYSGLVGFTWFWVDSQGFSAKGLMGFTRDLQVFGVIQRASVRFKKSRNIVSI